MYILASLSRQANSPCRLTSERIHFFPISLIVPFPPSHLQYTFQPGFSGFSRLLKLNTNVVPLSLLHRCSPMGWRKRIRKDTVLGILYFIWLHLKQGEVSLLWIITPALGNSRASFCFWSDLFLSTKFKKASIGESLKTQEQKVLRHCGKQSGGSSKC